MQANPIAVPGETTSYSSVQLRLRDSVTRQLYFRSKTSDESVIDQNLVKLQYDLRRLRRAPELIGFVQRGIANGKRPLVIDAGAHIGASSIFFAVNIESAIVVAIEPDLENFQLLQKNINGLDVQAVHAAVSSTRGRARVVDPGEGHWGYRTENLPVATSIESVPRLTINDMYQQCTALCFPFVVKIDIEGGEAELFSSNTEWIARTPLLIVELHDWLLLRSGNSRPFLQCISQLDRDFVYIG